MAEKPQTLDELLQPERRKIYPSLELFWQTVRLRAGDDPDGTAFLKAGESVLAEWRKQAGLPPKKADEG
jgi:hypothetical protein